MWPKGTQNTHEPREMPLCWERSQRRISVWMEVGVSLGRILGYHLSYLESSAGPGKKQADHGPTSEVPKRAVM